MRHAVRWEIYLFGMIVSGCVFERKTWMKILTLFVCVYVYSLIDIALFSCGIKIERLPAGLGLIVVSCLALMLYRLWNQREKKAKTDSPGMVGKSYKDKL